MYTIFIVSKGLWNETTASYILKALIPYTDANLNLAFKPSAFFFDLEKLSNRKRQTVINAYYNLVKQGFITIDDAGMPRLTEKGRRSVVDYKAIKLKGDVVLMVLFDIPETERFKRDRLRLLLHELSFRQVQKSVWVSEYDYREYLRAEIKKQGLGECVLVYEAHKLK